MKGLTAGPPSGHLQSNPSFHGKAGRPGGKSDTEMCGGKFKHLSFSYDLSLAVDLEALAGAYGSDGIQGKGVKRATKEKAG
ncbi:MAG: hypothetical protein HS115_02645 [Spirochaetales bacterium]|nr:hypothetical protein [Spirochaetales bacterium]